jgi:sugar/nucleoside kinase (ribokinase family)
VVDETGCGNCFCGAFTASVLAGDGLRDALTLASAAASIMVEHIGVPNGSIDDEYRALAATRARAVDATVTSFSVA